MGHIVREGDEYSTIIVAEWLAQIAAGKSFIDIGGLGGRVTNERVSAARSAGATDLALADILEDGHEWWDVFRQRCRDSGIEYVEEVSAFDVMDETQLHRIGARDIVNSTGIMYHCADMLTYLRNLRTITGEYAITNTVTLPRVIKNENGEVHTPPAACMFLPALTAAQRDVLHLHYSRKFPKMLGLDNISPPASAESRRYYVREGQLSTMPNWWFISREALLAMCTLCGFAVIEEYIFRGHASVLLLKTR